MEYWVGHCVKKLGVAVGEILDETPAVGMDTMLYDVCDHGRDSWWGKWCNVNGICAHYHLLSRSMSCAEAPASVPGAEGLLGFQGLACAAVHAH